MASQKENNFQTEADRNLSAILSSMGEGLLIIDSRMKVALMNQAAGIYLRTAPSSTAGKDVHEILVFFHKGKQLPLQSSPISRAVEESGTVKVGLGDDIFCKDSAGKLFPVKMSVTGLRGYGNIGAVIIFNDATREKEVDRMKTEFVSIASHQLRTPLAAIKLFSEMLATGQAGKLNDEQKNFVNNVRESTERMIRLVNDLLNVSRLETGRLSIEPKATNVLKFVEDIVNEAEIVAEEHGCRILFEKPDEEMGEIAIDRILMREVLLNLVTNAIFYSPHLQGGCEIEMTLARKDGGYVITVKDEGIGIPREDHHKVFEKFYRADNARMLAAEGSGLGLYVVKMIMDASGGKIWFESPPKGKQRGTAFHVFLPAQGMREKKGERGLAA